MDAIQRIAVKASDAAKLFSLTRNEFLKLVSLGILPPPINAIPNHQLWSVEQLKRALSGQYSNQKKFTP